MRKIKDPVKLVFEFILVGILFFSYGDRILTILGSTASQDCCSEAYRNVQRTET